MYGGQSTHLPLKVNVAGYNQDGLDLRATYDYPTQGWGKLRGTVVAPAVEAMCTLCHMKLRPLMWVDLKKNEEIFQCPACSRILFYEAPVPEVHPPL